MIKKILITFPVIFIIGCSTVNVGVSIDKLRPNEILGAGYDHLTGKLYSIFCGGNGYASFTDVKTKCLYEISKTAYENKYKYFTVINVDTDTENTPATTGYMINGSYYSYSYNITKHSVEYIFLLIEENEISKYKNYYIVKDYYTPSSDNNTQKENKWKNQWQWDSTYN